MVCKDLQFLNEISFFSRFGILDFLNNKTLDTETKTKATSKGKPWRQQNLFGFLAMISHKKEIYKIR